MDMPAGSYGFVSGDHGADSPHFSSGPVGYEPTYSSYSDNGSPGSVGGGTNKYAPDNFSPVGPMDVGPADYVRNTPMDQQTYKSSETHGKQGNQPMAY
jgi:hypothetical protein